MGIKNFRLRLTVWLIAAGAAYMLFIFIFTSLLNNAHEVHQRYYEAQSRVEAITGIHEVPLDRIHIYRSTDRMCVYLDDSTVSQGCWEIDGKGLK